jgi:predicted Fe-Mo cluster-binding NifX family protein
MKIAVASQNQKEVSGHLGRCRNFWIYQTDDQSVLERQLLQLTKEETFHESSPKDAHPLDGTNVLIAGSFGQGLGRRLASKGIEALATSVANPDEAVNAYLQGTLAIAEGDHHHDHEHEHDHAHHHHHHHEHQHGECNCHS